MTLFRTALGHVIREERKDRGLTMREITGVSIGHLSDVERGQKEVSSEVLQAIADGMQVPMWLLLDKTAKEMRRELQLQS